QSDMVVTAAVNGTAAGFRVVKVGPGTLTLDPRDAAGNPVVGTTGTISDIRIFEGTLRIPAGQTLANVTPNFVLANGGTLAYAGTALSSTRTVALVGSGGTLDLTGTALQLSLA